MEKNFATYLRDERMLFKYAQGKSARNGREFHEYHEIIWLIAGEVEFFSEEIRAPLICDQIVMIPKESYHQFVIRGDEEHYRRCVFNFYDLPELSAPILCAMQGVRIMDPTPELKALFHQVIRAAESDRLSDQEKKAILRSVMTLLIFELAQSVDVAREELPQKDDSLVSRCVEYINRHLSEPLTVAGIARALNISPSLLSHTFKNEMHIAPYRYILKKRLILAQNKIARGESATAAAIECGFGDYSGFYKQYKKTFGRSPSHTEDDFEA